MKYKFILYNPWLLKTPGTDIKCQGTNPKALEAAAKPRRRLKPKLEKMPFSPNREPQKAPKAAQTLCLSIHWGINTIKIYYFNIFALSLHYYCKVT